MKAIPHRAATRRLVVHCSASDFGCVNVVDDWHEKENLWSDIGYHRVITNGVPFPGAPYDPIGDGGIEYGRDERVIGSGAKGYNHDSLHVCLIGQGGLAPGGTCTPAQIYSLKTLCAWWMPLYGLTVEDIVGHCDLPGVTKSCPDLDMALVRAFISTADRAEECRIIETLKGTSCSKK